MAHVSLTTLRKSIATYFDAAVANREPLVVTRPARKGNVVVISEADYRSLEETVYLLSSPANAADLLASIAEFNAGKLEEHELIDPKKTR